ncbi:MAG: shikimate 5-dehydrogenase [Solirubrobacteraceae bacterium]|jgi:shikimate dehydrogenase
MRAPITKDTALCMSLAGTPTNIGTRFHNYLYEQLGLDFIYKAFTTTDLPAAIAGIRALAIRGCGISMPYKEACLQYVDEVDDSARAIESVNTIVNSDSHLHAYNTDYIAVKALLAASRAAAGDTFAVLGAGGMAKAVAAALHDRGLRAGTVVARNERAGRALAQRYGYDWQATLDDARPQLLINATPVGMDGGPGTGQLSFPAAAVGDARIVFDVVASPALTPLIRLAQSLDKTVVTGAEVIMLQAVEQFVLYTGVRPSGELAQRASELSREPSP